MLRLFHRPDFALLDRPIWSALTTRQSHFAESLGSAWLFPSQIGPFAACASTEPRDMHTLATLAATQGRSVVTLEAGSASAHRPCAFRQNAAEVVQMVATSVEWPRGGAGITVLEDKDMPAMLALARATQPGPFAKATALLGTFIGVWQDGALIAMAGQRLKVPGFTEISAVCVDPRFRGQGLGAELVRDMARRIRKAGDVPFLHAYASNRRAIALYERLGFRLRRTMLATTLAAPELARAG